MKLKMNMYFNLKKQLFSQKKKKIICEFIKKSKRVN